MQGCHRHFVPTVLLVVAMAGAARAEKVPSAKLDIVPPTPEWIDSIRQKAPAHPTVAGPKRELLVFSLFTGYDHKVIPHVDRVFEVLAEKSGAFAAIVTTELDMLTPERLASFDAIVLNNNCSAGDRRNLFLDELERNAKYQGMSEAERQAKADLLEQSLLEFVSHGKGLVAIHGATTMLNRSAKFTEMIGAAFDYHPPNQELTIRTVHEDHPMVAAFRGKGPFVHRDEPYLFNGPYEAMNFRPLLVMDAESVKDPSGRFADRPRYVAWIKRHGDGRVFYCSPSHFPESYESTTLLQFLLDGVQYATGDLKCDDSKP
jgi:uncharacterized protein